MFSRLTEEKIVQILYRPFDVRYTYYTGHSWLSLHASERNNVSHACGRKPRAYHDADD